MRRDELKEGYEPQPKNILITDGRHGPDYLPFYRLALCLELEARGCNPILILENSTVEGGFLHSEGYRCALSELQEAMPEERFECLLGLLERRKQNPDASSFQVIEEEGETYLVFPEINQDLKKIQGAFLTKTDIALQRKIEFVNPHMYFHNSTRMLEKSISKVECDRHLKEDGVPLPATARFPNISSGHFRPYSLEIIARKFEEEGVEPPYIIKSDLGYGAASVYKAQTIEQAQTIINDIMRIYGEGCVVQHRIPSSPDAGDRSEHIRAVVCDGRVIVAERNRGVANTFPDKVTKDGTVINQNFYAQREICTLTPEQEEIAIKAGRALKPFPWRGIQENYVCGVDMSVTHPPVVFEINDSPGFDYYVVEGTDAVAQLAEIMNDNVEIQIAASNRCIDILTKGGVITEETQARRSRIEKIISERGPQDSFLRFILEDDRRKALKVADTIEEINPYSPKAVVRGRGR